MGIFFRKPKPEGAPSAADERRSQNSDTSKIRWIPYCVKTDRRLYRCDRTAERILDYSHTVFHCRRLTQEKVITVYIH